jgi:pimeloyl-ACP methyl ester carboxylesterase/class 3 adenylate cyclase
VQPKTEYTKSGDIHIAYQVKGDGPLDVIFIAGFVSHLEQNWEMPAQARFLDRLASFSRLILFDKRGMGLSDRGSQIFTLEQRMDDVRAVMDAVGTERAALFGVSEGGPMSVLFAATYPERTTALVMYGSYSRRSWAPDHAFGLKDDQWEAIFDGIENHWGTPVGLNLDIWAPSVAQDEGFRRLTSDYLRRAASPGAALAVMRMNQEIDVRHVLPTVRTPTLILHRTGDRVINVEQSRYMARQIPGAKLIEFPGNDHFFSVGDSDAITDEVEEFLTGVRPRPEPDRVLATVMFTDIVSATETAASMGDRQWRELLQNHHTLVRRELSRYHGREIDTAGDGFFATFDGPARAIRCACAIRDAITSLGITIRAGLHTGECEMMGEKIGGIAVHLGARVVAEARSGEVLVSSTVKDLVAGSGLRFIDRGVHTLKGIPGDWNLFAVEE